MAAGLTYREYVRACKRHYLEAVLIEAGGNVKQAARLAGCQRTAFYRLLASVGLYRPGEPLTIARRPKQDRNELAPLLARWT